MKKYQVHGECGIRNAELARGPFRIPNAQFRIRASHLVGGVNSPVRAFRQVGALPVHAVRARGAFLWDADGHRFLDCIMGWGPLLLGHNPPAVVHAVRKALRRGELFGLTHAAEEELARLIADAIPSIEQVRLTVSGTEACLTAIRLAQAVTGRRAVLMFEGGYHGHAESLLDVIRVTYNDVEEFEAAVRRHGRRVAAVIVEPVAANMGVVLPHPAFLPSLRRRTQETGSLLIFDEVVTGFRVGPAGAQGRFGVRPDLTVLGKIIGGGLPIGAIGSTRRLLQRLAPEGDVYHGGTFAGHPLSVAAGVAALRQLREVAPYDALERLGDRLASGLINAGHAAGIPLQVNRCGSMLTVFFTGRPVRCAADGRRADRTRFAAWVRALRDAGVLVPPSPSEAMFLATAHTAAHVDRLVTATHRALRGRPRLRRAAAMAAKGR